MLVMMNFSRGRISLELGKVPEGSVGEDSCPGRYLLEFAMAFPESVSTVLREVRTTGELSYAYPRVLLPRQLLRRLEYMGQGVRLGRGQDQLSC